MHLSTRLSGLASDASDPLASAHSYVWCSQPSSETGTGANERRRTTLRLHTRRATLPTRKNPSVQRTVSKGKGCTACSTTLSRGRQASRPQGQAPGPEALLLGWRWGIGGRKARDSR